MWRILVLIVLPFTALPAGATIVESGWSGLVYLNPPAPAPSAAYQIYFERHVFYTGIDDEGTWPVKAKDGAPLAYWKNLMVHDAFSNTDYPDFTGAMKASISADLEYRTPSLAGARVIEPTIKYNCHALTNGLTTVHLPDMASLYNVITGFGHAVTEPVYGGWARHQLGLGALSAGHSSASTIYVEVTVLGITFNVWKYMGKFGLAGVYIAPLSAVSDEYDDSVIHYIWD